MAETEDSFLNQIVKALRAAGVSEKEIANAQDSVMEQLEELNKMGPVPDEEIMRLWKAEIRNPEIWKKVEQITNAQRVDRKEIVEDKIPTEGESVAKAEPPKVKTVIRPEDRHTLQFILEKIKDMDANQKQVFISGLSPEYQNTYEKYKGRLTGQQANQLLTEMDAEGKVDTNIKKNVRTSNLPDFTLNIPNYGRKIPANTEKVWHLGRLIQDVDLDKTKLNSKGQKPYRAWEPNLIASGHQEAIIIPKSLVEASWLEYGAEPPTKNASIVMGFDSKTRKNIEKVKGGIDFNYGVAAEVTNSYQLNGTWWEDKGEIQKLAKKMGITSEALDKLVNSGRRNTGAPGIEGKYIDAYVFELKALTEADVDETWVKAEEGINLKATTVEDVAASWGFNPAKNVELGKLLKGIIPLIGSGVAKSARVLDYGEFVYGWMANGIAATIGKLGKPGEVVTKVVGQGSKEGTAKLAAAGGEVGEEVLEKVGKKIGGRAATGSVKAMGLYEKYNFLYGIASGLILSAIETLGIVGKDMIGQQSIRNALGDDYEQWAESNGVIDKIGPWPLLKSLEQAEEEGILSDGFTDEYVNWTNDKWINVLYEFLGTEGYDDMEGVNTVWRERRAPQGWFGSINDVFGLNSTTALANAGFIPETGLMPAIKRSPIITGIEIPFENWLFPKIGLEDWVYPEGETVSDDALLEELYSEPITIIDNNAWMGNMTQALGGDDG